LATLRVNIALIVLFFLLDLTFLLLMAGEFTENLTIHKAGGAVGIATAFAAFYAGTAQLLTKDNSWFTLPLGTFARRHLD
jgi:succinate-acetate transporter protein